MAEWYDKLLALQLRTNRDIWAGLQEHLEADSELRLGFVYLAPGETEAQALVEFLDAETDYEVEARRRPDEEGADPDRSWVVIGTTQPTAVTLDMLDDWVEWMIAAGAAHGPCAFDGWAAQLADE